MPAKMTIRKKNGSTTTHCKQTRRQRFEESDEFWLPKTSPEAKSAVLSRVTLRAGTIKHKPPKAGRWKKNAQARNRAARTSSITVGFDMKLHHCKGGLEEVMDLGIQLAREEMEAGNHDRAQAVIDRVKMLPEHYENRATTKELKQLVNRIYNLKKSRQG